MKIDEVLTENVLLMKEDIVDDILEEGFAENLDEAVELLENRIANAVRKHAAQYGSRKPPEILAFQSPENRQHVAVLAAGDNMYYRFDVIGGKVVSEERFSSFNDLMTEKDILTTQRFYSIDPRRWLTRNWKAVALSVVGGYVTFTGAPIILAGIAALVSAALAWLASVAIMGGVIAGSGYLAVQLVKNKL